MGTVSGQLWPGLACVAWYGFPRGVARRNEGVMPAQVLDVLEAEWQAENKREHCSGRMKIARQVQQQVQVQCR